jgi:beta-glucosidase
VKQPLRQLRGFARVALRPGERTVVRLRLRAADLAHWDVTRGRLVVEEGHHTVAVGRSCTDLVMTATLAVRGERIPPQDPLVAPLRAENCDEAVGTALIPDAVTARAANAWLRFAAVDLDGPLHRVAAAMHGPAGSSLVLRVDDPVFGTALATFDAPEQLAEVGSAVPDVHGVRDLYLVFSAPGVTVSTLTFS